VKLDVDKMYLEYNNCISKKDYSNFIEKYTLKTVIILGYASFSRLHSLAGEVLIDRIKKDNERLKKSINKIKNS